MRMKTQMTLCIAFLLLLFGIKVPNLHVPNDTTPNQNTGISTYAICPPQIDNY